MIKTILASALIALSFNAQAEDEGYKSKAGLHLGSYHIGGDECKGLNNFNPGAFFVHGGSGATIGYYRNSIKRDSVYLGWTWRSNDDRFNLTIAAVTGYVKKESHFVVGEMTPRPWGKWNNKYETTEKDIIMPMIAPSVRVWDGFRVSFIPKYKTAPALLHATFEKTFNAF